MPEQAALLRYCIMSSLQLEPFLFPVVSVTEKTFRVFGPKIACQAPGPPKALLFYYMAVADFPDQSGTIKLGSKFETVSSVSLFLISNQDFAITLL